MIPIGVRNWFPIRVIAQAVFVAVVFASVTVFAQSIGGVAFVEAPEQGSGMCFADNADKGFACAREKCMASGALSEDCYRVKWCYPAGWSADIFKQHREGNHWHEYLCGWDSESDLDAAIAIACKGSSAEYLIECAAVAKWSPDGKMFEVEP